MITTQKLHAILRKAGFARTKPLSSMAHTPGYQIERTSPTGVSVYYYGGQELPRLASALSQAGIEYKERDQGLHIRLA